MVEARESNYPCHRLSSGRALRREIVGIVRFGRRGPVLAVAAMPAPRRAEHTYWPPVARIDNAFGDRNLVCTWSAPLGG